MLGPIGSFGGVNGLRIWIVGFGVWWIGVWQFCVRSGVGCVRVGGLVDFLFDSLYPLNY